MAEEAAVETEKVEAAPAPVADAKEQLTAALKGVEKSPTQESPSNKAFAALRKEKEKAEKEAAALRAEKAERVSTQTETAPKKTDVFDDPDAWAEDVKRQAREDAIAAARQLDEEKRRIDSAEKAESWLLSRVHFTEDKAFAQDVVAYLSSDEGQKITRINPQRAAKFAYDEALEKRGITNGDDARSTMGVRPSAPSVGGKRVFNRGEIQAYIYAVNPDKDYPGFQKRLREVEEAEKEGRIK